MYRSMALVVLFVALVALGAGGVAAPTTAKIEDIPVREVTIFKDGHAFVTHEGQLEIKEGAVILEHVPEPVLGTFWPYARGRRVTLKSVVAAWDDVAESRTAISLPELIRANTGKRATLLVQMGGEVETIEGTLVGVPERSVERETTSPPRREYDYRSGRHVEVPASTSVGMVEERGDIVLVQTAEGLRTVKLGSVLSASFPDEAEMDFEETVKKRRLRLNIEGGRGESVVGMTYLQKGLRWIPQYAVFIEDDGTARIKLQGTIVNDMVDLDDVTVHLVVGVPNFMFKDQISPIALREAAAQLSQYFEQASATGYAFSNAIMSQSLAYNARLNEPAGIALPMEGGAEAIGPHEDLFLYKVEHVTLKKGERMVVPVIEVQATYKDAYTWDIPFCPPPELLRHLNDQQREEMMMLSRASRVHHVLRITNKSEVPLTTGPALILKDGRLLAQSMIRYTSVGNTVDVDVTVATDIHAKKWEKQTDRQDNAKSIGGHSFSRLDMRGFLELTNYKEEAVTVEITRAVLGTLTEADNEGEITHLNSFEDMSFLPEGDLSWSGWYWRWWSRWPWWWHYANDIGQVKWTVTLEPGVKRVLQYEWYHYAW